MSTTWLLPVLLVLLLGLLGSIYVRAHPRLFLRHRRRRSGNATGVLRANDGAAGLFVVLRDSRHASASTSLVAIVGMMRRLRGAFPATNRTSLAQFYRFLPLHAR